MTTFELDITLRQGSFTLAIASATEARSMALFGPSGSGKTSALEAIAGLRTPQRGRIAIGGRVLFDSTAGINLPARLRKVGYVPQDVLLFPHLTVRDNVLYGSGAGTGPPFDEVIDLLDLSALLPRGVRTLSGGERQRVALARALQSAPDVLLLDEPLAAVDLRRRRRIVEALLRVRDDLAIPLVYVTHTPEEAMTIAEFTLVLESGLLAGVGPSAAVLGTARD